MFVQLRTEASPRCARLRLTGQTVVSAAEHVQNREHPPQSRLRRAGCVNRRGEIDGFYLHITY
jgi:hypothetical protein